MRPARHRYRAETRNADDIVFWVGLVGTGLAWIAVAGFFAVMG